MRKVAAQPNGRAAVPRKDREDKMASKARAAFDESRKDVDRLLEIHGLIGGPDKGRRYQLGVLNKSAIVLISAIWEAYCEDIASEAIEHIVAESPKSSALSKEIRKAVAKELKDDKNELAVWNIADDGWRSVLRSRLKTMQEKRAWSLNTPKAAQIRASFANALGIDDITAEWRWEKMSSAQAQKKLDTYITLRGEIAHRGSVKECYKWQVQDFLNHVDRLVGKTGKVVNKHVKAMTGKKLW
ncbi:MAG: hypothetical protein JWQ87_3872 [Candidatus Sulfotelmatobacter sp.]|nr:hypothetical protein [Candidatus Sulfotelmatobacter sp.]